MTQTAVTISEFRVGSILGRGFSILFKNIVPFGMLSLIVNAPPFIYAFFVDPALYLGQTGEFTGGLVAILIIQTLLAYLVNATLVYGTVQDLRGRQTNIGDCISRGLAVMFPVIGVAILMILATSLGMLLLIIPGLIVMTMLWVAIPAAIVERPGVFASLRRSRELTKGFRWKVFGLIILILISQWAIGWVTGFVLRMSGSIPAVLLGNLLVTVFFTALWAVVSAVGYHDLRVVKEGVGTEEIAAVFD